MRRGTLCIVAALLSSAAHTSDEAEQQFHTLKDFVMDSGKTLDCTVGYRTYGSPDDAGSGVVVFPTWFGGTTADLEHFEKVGTGALADSNRFFVITIDALGNSVSCSPSNHESLSDTPVTITTADMVRSQHRLLTEKFRIDRVHAILGISMGGMQALRWLELYPGFPDKVVSIDGSPQMTSYDLLHWTVHREVVRSLQQAGAPDETIGGVVARMSNLTLFTPEYFVETIPREALDEFLAPAYEPRPAFRSADYVSQLDAMMNHDVLSDNFVERARESGVDVLIVSTPNDHMVNQRPAQALAGKIGAAVLSVDSICGHLGSTCESKSVNAHVASFLERQKARQ